MHFPCVQFYELDYKINIYYTLLISLLANLAYFFTREMMILLKYYLLMVRNDLH